MIIEDVKRKGLLRIFLYKKAGAVMELKKREGLGKKIAIGVSLINLANMVGPVGVPVADTSIPGGVHTGG